MRSRSKVLTLATALLLFSQTSIQGTEFDHDYKSYDRFLTKYVEAGLVSYESIHSHMADLETVVAEFAAVTKEEFNKFESSEQVAYFINAYNLYTIKAVVDHYPVGSIKDISGVWNRLKFQVAGRKMTLDNIEHDYLRKKFEEPRIHVAIVCASISCPELWDKPFTPDSLDQQLEERSAAFANDTLRNKIDTIRNTVSLSKILKWYGDDFIDRYKPESRFNDLSDKKAATVNFLYQYWPEPVRRAMNTREVKVTYKKYDWHLNEN